MYLNLYAQIIANSIIRLTVTLDVFKSKSNNLSSTSKCRLTVTLDVFKSMLNNQVSF